MILDAGQLWQAISQLYLGVAAAISSVVEGSISYAGKKRKAAADRQGAREVEEGMRLDACQEGQSFAKRHVASVVLKLLTWDASHIRILRRIARFVELPCEACAAVGAVLCCGARN